MKSCKKAEFDWFKDKAYSPLQSQTKALVPVAKKSPGKRGRVLIRLTAGVSRLDFRFESHVIVIVKTKSKANLLSSELQSLGKI